MDSTHIPLLEDLGLTEQEARAYLASLELGPASVQDIAERAGVKRTSVYNFIGELVDTGILTQTEHGKRTLYTAASPEVLADMQERRLRRLRERMGELTALANLTGTRPRIRYFEGSRQMQQIEREALSCKELLAVWNRSRVISQLGTEYMEELDRERRARGVRIRLIAVRGEGADFTGGQGDETREIRFAPKGMEFPMAISVYDTGKVGFMTSAEEGFGILIESRELELTMRNMFEAFWMVSEKE